MNKTPLRFTREELALLQQALHLSSLPGLPDNLLASLPEEQQAQIIQAADHSLRARTLVGWNSAGERVIDDRLQALFHDYARPDATLFVDTLVAGKRQLPFLYVFARALYEQCQPEPAVYQLRLFSYYHELLQRLTPVISLRSAQRFEELSGEITQSLLTEGVKIAQQNREKASALFATSLPDKLAETLARAYAEPAEVIQYLARWRPLPSAEQTKPEAALTIILFHQQIFLLEVDNPDQGTNAHVTVKAATPRMLEQAITQILPQVTDRYL
ncbi:hypothetical protein [Tengunoibacter tsumagoiensis]|uniref:Uncharacterized protein n=1 Tax=Tengunoibacter tsumagoiensis TaxID=2014871 RepID=A0A401ZWM8_9CHLR|nr:hypothetical protein [Tengunoibacter tsumagoiensis]GCE11285.1 hypothetical protein KTT_11440 [Tengunoibacter tsumagoiensis]